MISVNRLMRRVRLLVRRRDAERSMEAELQHHLACEIADRVRQGLPTGQARRAALLDFGNVERVKEEGRDARGGRSIEDAVADLGYAGRVLRHNPGFTAAGLLTFALGIGAATAIFALVYGVLLRPLSYPNADRLAVLWEHDVDHDRPRNVVSADTFEAWRDRSRSFAGMAAVVPASATLGDGATAERIAAAEISPQYFGVLGITPALGRDFEPADATTGSVVILSDALWRRRFGGDRGVVGSSIRIGRQAYTVVGVMPAAFDPPRLSWLGEQSLWFPLALDAQHRAWGRAFIVVARLAESVHLDQARSEMLAIAAARAREIPANKGWSVSLVPLADQITGHVRRPLGVLLGVVVLLLAIAVTNVGTLTLALVRRRGHELSIRRAIGATERRLFGQLFSQSAMLGTLGTAAGVIVAWLGVRILLDLMPPDVPRTSDIRLDAPVLAAAGLVGLIATLIFGSAVAVRGRAGVDLSAAQGAGQARVSRHSGGRALVVAEVALALVLSLMAMLMVRSFVALRHVDLGFRPEGLVAARIALPDASYASAASQRDFFARLLARVRALPGVTSAALISTRPFGGMSAATRVGDPSAGAGRGAIVADVRYADRAIFTALGVDVKSGEPFDDRDLTSPGVVISADLARTLWPGQPAVGRALEVALDNGITARVAGVVGEVHLFDARTPARPAIYLSTARFTSTVRDVVVRVDGDPAAIVPALRGAVAEIEPGLPVYAVRTMPELVGASLASDRFTTLLLSSFALVALALAAIGIVGVLSGEIGARRREIGIRLALGAPPRGIAMLFLGRALRRAAIGILLGAGLALVLTRGMTALVFGVSAHDPGSLVAVILIVLAVTILSTLVPAVQAIRRSPLDALHES